MKKTTSGFTLVELLVVIIVIVILAGISYIAFARFQMQARDNKRSADVTVLMSKLNGYYSKNQEYPPSCDQSSYNSATQQCNPISAAISYTAGPPINSSTTNTQLAAILPGVTADTQDPLSGGR